MFFWRYKIFGFPVAILIGICLLAALLSGGYFWHLVSQYQPVNAADTRVISVEIPQGSSAGAMGNILKEAGLIRNAKVFVSYCKNNGLDQELKAGFYSLSPSQSIQEIADIIATGAVTQERVTIPEGYTVQQIGNLLMDRGLVKESDWQQALTLTYEDYSFLPPASSEGSRLEGYLFPDTYFVAPYTNAAQIIDMMLRRFQQVWQEESLFEQLEASGRSQHEIVTIASMIEREAMVKSEMPRIAGVIYNRLGINMPLQIDATILFALQEHKDKVLLRDLEVASPYNTYRNVGLPPGPIANPGATAMKAALAPEEHNYYYYVAKGNGEHEFNRTFDKHLEAQRRYANQ